MADPDLQYLWRCPVAFLLGLLSFVVLVAAGEGLGLVAAMVCSLAYFFACQFLLSLRENSFMFFNRVVGGNMPIIVALDLPVLIIFLMIRYGEKLGVALAQGVPYLLLASTGTFAGAATALFIARRKIESRP